MVNDIIYAKNNTIQKEKHCTQSKMDTDKKGYTTMKTSPSYVILTENH